MQGMVAVKRSRGKPGQIWEKDITDKFGTMAAARTGINFATGRIVAYLEWFVVRMNAYVFPQMSLTHEAAVTQGTPVGISK